MSARARRRRHERRDPSAWERASAERGLVRVCEGHLLTHLSMYLEPVYGAHAEEVNGETLTVTAAFFPRWAAVIVLAFGRTRSPERDAVMARAARDPELRAAVVALWDAEETRDAVRAVRALGTASSVAQALAAWRVR